MAKKYEPKIKGQKGKIKSDTYFAKGKTGRHYPSNTTIRELKKAGVSQIVYENGDFLTL